MSSYLTIYGVPKNEGKPIDIVSFSRSHCIYSAICDEVNVAWAGESEVQYTVDMEKIKQVRYSTGRGMYICKMLAERKESVEEAVKLYHDIMKVIVNG